MAKAYFIYDEEPSYCEIHPLGCVSKTAAINETTNRWSNLTEREDKTSFTLYSSSIQDLNAFLNDEDGTVNLFGFNSVKKVKEFTH